MLKGEVKLSLDFEIKEPKDIYFNKITDITAESKNNIYILDRKEKQLYKFSEEGEFQKKIGRSGRSPGEFEEPISVFIDANDNIYILDSQNRRVEVFNNNGNITRSIKLDRYPTGGKNSIAVDENTNINITGFYVDENVVFSKYSPSGEFLEGLPFPIIDYDGIELRKLEKSNANRRLAGGSLCLDKKNRIIFSYKWPYKIYIIDNEEIILSDISGKSNLNGHHSFLSHRKMVCFLEN